MRMSTAHSGGMKSRRFGIYDGNMLSRTCWSVEDGSTALMSMSRGWTVRFNQSMSGRSLARRGIPKIQSKKLIRSITWNASLLGNPSNR